MERDPPDPAAFRAAIEAFLKERLNAKLDKLADDDPKRAALATKHHPSLWITDAAARSGHVKLATHVAKATHPKAKGSSLYRPPSSLVRRKEVGTHAIGQAFVSDAAVDDAKHLDVSRHMT